MRTPTGRQYLSLVSIALLTAILMLTACKGERKALESKGEGGNITQKGDPVINRGPVPGRSGTGSLQLLCRKAPGAVTVDGMVLEYGKADTLRLDDPADIPDPNRVKIYTLWDKKYLYIAFEVEDRFLTGFQTERDHRALYKDDMIEVLIDPRRDATDLWLEDDIVYHINILGQVKDDRGTPGGRSDALWQSRALFAVRCEGTINDSTDLDRGYSVELAVPWDEIGLAPGPGVSLGIDFASGDAEGPDEHLWDWCGANPFRQPSVYGKLVLQ
ncbi:MAG: carbohydrate-binding family 9-like protein [Gemmatimonadota bacterium]|nr:carbohydrate-binding family 9-like protein [Gemmatimonadota bacterium]